MGSISSCCSASDVNLESEIRESKMEKEPPLKDAPSEMAPPLAASRDKEFREKDAGGRGTEYEVVLDKTAGKRMGIDVDHKDGKTLLIECINDGLIKDWNETAAPGQKVAINDRITEVNGFREEVARLVDECQKDQMLRLKVARPA
mmetsp:Transcript_103451/g.126426  ORF Transcript_103451/g.126426 Transcript_103451/m.126426 type:complete len:146 (-) Transcript_103451:98-535(-)